MIMIIIILLLLLLFYFLIKSTPIPKKNSELIYNTFKWQDRAGLTRLNEV